MIPMTADWTALHARVDLMHPAGNTNQTIGLQWAWQSLTQTDPLNAPAKDPNYQYKDIIILLTDGLNTENRWSQTASSVDKRTQKACDNIRTAEITLYTVLVMAGNATLLQGCATDQTKYFALTSADQLITTFNTIGGQLAKLHLAK
jgi:Mg-chelatase subunit ChlD